MWKNRKHQHQLQVQNPKSSKPRARDLGKDFVTFHNNRDLILDYFYDKKLLGYLLLWAKLVLCLSLAKNLYFICLT